MKIKVNTMSDALLLSLKIYRIMLPIIVAFFFVLGIVLYFVLDSFVLLGIIFIGLSLLFAIIFTIIYLAVKNKYNKQLEIEKSESEE